MIRYDAREAAFYRQKLLERVQEDIRECYQCGNCTAGCPVAFTYDYMPNQMMRMLQVGMVDELRRRHPEVWARTIDKPTGLAWERMLAT